MAQHILCPHPLHADEFFVASRCGVEWFRCDHNTSGAYRCAPDDAELLLLGSNGRSLTMIGDADLPALRHVDASESCTNEWKSGNLTTACVSSEVNGRLCVLALDDGTVVATQWGADEIAGVYDEGHRVKRFSAPSRPAHGTSLSLLFSSQHRDGSVAVASCFVSGVNPLLLALGNDQGFVQLFDLSMCRGVRRNYSSSSASWNSAAFPAASLYEDDITDQLQALVSLQIGTCVTAVESIPGTSLTLCAGRHDSAQQQSSGLGNIGPRSTRYGMQLGVSPASLSSSVATLPPPLGTSVTNGSAALLETPLAGGPNSAAAGLVARGGGFAAPLPPAVVAAPGNIGRYSLQLQDLRCPASCGIQQFGGSMACASRASGNGGSQLQTPLLGSSGANRCGIFAEKVAVHPLLPLVASCGTYRPTRTRKKKLEIVQLWDTRQPSAPLSQLQATCSPHTSLKWKPVLEPVLLGITTHDVRLWYFEDSAALGAAARPTGVSCESGTEGGTEEGWVGSTTDTAAERRESQTHLSDASDDGEATTTAAQRVSSSSRASLKYASSSPTGTGKLTTTVRGGRFVVLEALSWCKHQPATTARQRGGPDETEQPRCAPTVVAAEWVLPPERQHRGGGDSTGSGVVVVEGTAVEELTLLTVDHSGLPSVVLPLVGVCHTEVPVLNSGSQSSTSSLVALCNGRNVWLQSAETSLVSDAYHESRAAREEDAGVLGGVVRLNSGAWTDDASPAGGRGHESNETPESGLQHSFGLQRASCVSWSTPELAGSDALYSGGHALRRRQHLQQDVAAQPCHHRRRVPPAFAHESRIFDHVPGCEIGIQVSLEDVWHVMFRRMKCHVSEVRLLRGSRTADATAPDANVGAADDSGGGCAWRYADIPQDSVPQRRSGNTFLADDPVTARTLLATRELFGWAAVRYAALWRMCQEKGQIPSSPLPPSGLVALVDGAVGPSAQSDAFFAKCYATASGAQWCEWAPAADPLRELILQTVGWLPRQGLDDTAHAETSTGKGHKYVGDGNVAAQLPPRLTGLDLAGATRSLREAVERRVGIFALLGHVQEALGMLNHYAPLSADGCDYLGVGALLTALLGDGATPSSAFLHSHPKGNGALITQALEVVDAFLHRMYTSVLSMTSLSHFLRGVLVLLLWRVRRQFTETWIQDNASILNALSVQVVKEPQGDHRQLSQQDQQRHRLYAVLGIDPSEMVDGVGTASDDSSSSTTAHVVAVRAAVRRIEEKRLTRLLTTGVFSPLALTPEAPATTLRIPLLDRVALAAVLLPSVLALRDCLAVLRYECCATPLSLIFEGFGDAGSKELQRYVDESGDVQLPCVLLAPYYSKSKSCLWALWNKQYTSALNERGLYHERARHDASVRTAQNRFQQRCESTALASGSGRLNCVASKLARYVEVRCSCGQGLHDSALVRSAVNTTTTSCCAAPAPQKTIAMACPNEHCKGGQQPVCAVCVKKIDLPGARLEVDRWFAWCTSCLHGGHWGHVRDWFSKHEKCPVDTCACECKMTDF